MMRSGNPNAGCRDESDDEPNHHVHGAAPSRRKPKSLAVVGKEIGVFKTRNSEGAEQVIKYRRVFA